ncbi:Histone acetyltransferase type B catalytic subunit [Acropora cervicornis]|uniref:Histone acetyltransferase type B catalytic subunit n=1 Tax=Acropora cervicornis TaxID=6130 RepID=A0AAD9VDC1_ACRCE|nr:Histone acetyltransferase type B catalytic subunit [Acropora cervicornis]
METDFASPKDQVHMVDQVLARYKCDSNTAVRFKLVQCHKDILDNGKEFHPTFSHQFFGDNLLTYMGLKHDGEVNNKPDPVLSVIAEKYPAGCMTNLDEFMAKLPEEAKFRPMGELLHSYKCNDTEYEIYKADVTTPRLKDYHERLQTFLLWFIDASSYIVYQYYAYPDKIRPRISQMLILPPFQKQGHGAQLLLTVDKFYVQDQQVLDITVEDPSYDFMRLRDYVDALRCRDLAVFSPENIRNGFSDRMVEQARKELKINKKEKADIEKLKVLLKPEEFTATATVQSTHERIQYLDQLYQELEEHYKKTIERIAAV